MNSAMILLALSVLLLTKTPGINGQEQERTATHIVCEFGTFQITCPNDDIIKIKSANYGRLDRTTCTQGRPSGQLNNVTCGANSSELILQENCDGKNRCSLQAHNSVFGDPCTGTYKYLKVEYFCLGELSELLKRVENLEKNAEESTNTMALLRHTISTMDTTIKTQISSLTSQVQTSLTHVFFSVGLTHAINSTSPQVIVFDKVWSNVGGGYSPTTGVFTCPVSGYYSFTVNVQTRWRRSAYLMLQHNNRFVYQAFTYGSFGHLGATNSAIIKLEAEDKVRVVTSHKPDLESDLHIFSSAHEIPTTFIGNLVAVA